MGLADHAATIATAVKQPTRRFPEKLTNTSVGRDSDGRDSDGNPTTGEPPPGQGEPPPPGRGEQPRPGERDRQHTQQ